MATTSVDMICAECQESIEVPIVVEIVNGDRAHEGRASLTCTPDLADLWAHMWIHTDGQETR